MTENYKVSLNYILLIFLISYEFLKLTDNWLKVLKITEKKYQDILENT